MNWKKVGEVAKAVWQILKWPLLAIAGVYAVSRGIEYLSGRGRVKEPRGFDLVPGDPTRIDVQTRDGAVRVKLPDGVDAHDVDSAGIGYDDGFAVEVRHEATDRRGTAGGPDNPDLRL